MKRLLIAWVLLLSTWIGGAYATNTFLRDDATFTALTYSVLQNVSASRLLGNPTGSSAPMSEIPLGAGLAFSGGSLVNTVTSFSPAAPNIQVFTSGTAATYTTPTSGGNLPLYIRVRMVGGGGSGASGTAGTSTSFAGWTAVAGSSGGSGAGSTGGAGGSGGTNGGTGTQISRVTGGAGQGGSGTANNNNAGGMGGASPFGGAGGGGNSSGQTAAANSGSGGGGGNSGSSSQAGGGAGEYVEFIISSPAASYTYTVGASGTNGAAGRIEVVAYWQ